VAAGATDVGGSVTYFRTYYGVLTLNEGPFEASAGAAKRSRTGVAGSQAPLGGGFAALAWQPVPLVRGHVEYAGGNAWAGVRVFAPDQWLPEGWFLSAGANVRVNNNRFTERTSWSASLSIPLYKVPALPGATKAPLPALLAGQQPLPAYEARTAVPPMEAGAKDRSSAPAPAPVPAPNVNLAPPTIAVTPVTDTQLRTLADALEAKALEDIWVGRMPDGTIAVRVNNGSYQWNAADALGVALGVVARTLGDSRAGYRLVLTQRQLPLVAVTGQADCLRQWIEQPANNCTAGQLSTPGSLPLEPLHDGAAWVVFRQNPAWQKVRVSVSPVLRTNFGTELGAYDYALGANVTAQLPLWTGANAEWGVNAPLANSDDYESNRVFGSRRVRSGTDRLTLTQLVRLPIERWLPGQSGLGLFPGAVTAQATVGRMGTFYDGAMGALRWEPGEGRHRFSAQAGAFRNNTFQSGFGPLGNLRRGNPVLGSYRYSLMATRTDLEATAGRFLNNDQGFQMGLRQWFSDVSVSLFYRRSAFTGQPNRQFAGIELSLPIGPRRDWQPLPHVQVGGARFEHTIETTIREGAGNPLRFGYGARPHAQDLDQAANADRSGLAYFEDNLRRIRDAAR
jgi:hypothetical protein